MKLGSYAALRSLHTINPARLAALAAHLRCPGGEEDLVAIGTLGGEPVAVTAWPLQTLAQPSGREAFLGFWSRSEADRIALVGYTTPGNESAAAGVVDTVAAFLEETRPNIVDAYRCLLVAGQRWGLSCDLVVEYDQGGEWDDLYAVEAIDVAGAVLTAAAIRAACRMRAEGRTIHQVWGTELERAQAAARSVQSVRAKVPDRARLLRGDQALFERCRERGSDVPVEDAIVLGVAASTNSLLCEWLVDQVLARPGTDLTGMWCTAARYASGTQRAIACAFAALSAWRDGDRLALIAGEAALDADDESDLAWAVWHLLETGATPDHLEYAVTATAPSTPVPTPRQPQD